MKPVARFTIGLALLGLPALVAWWWWQTTPPPPASAPTPPPTQAPVPAPPVLRPQRVPTADLPLHAHEELLTIEGSAAQDLGVVADLTRNYLATVKPATRGPLGFNEDLARALMDRDSLGENALPPDHPALRDGQLIDRWGRPWLVHPLASDLLQLRSAGPDGQLFTADDLVNPANVAEPAQNMGIGSALE
jgi:hypothetical protein